MNDCVVTACIDVLTCNAMLLDDILLPDLSSDAWCKVK